MELHHQTKIEHCRKNVENNCSKPELMYLRWSRRTTLRRNKKLVVWVFSAREFTRAESWSTKIPVVKKKG